MASQWLNNSSEVSGRIGSTLTGAVQTLSQPANMARLRQLVVFLLAIWAVLAFARLVWAFVPGSQSVLDAAPRVVNPVSTSSAATTETVDIAQMRSWHLFGKAGVAAPVAKTPKVVEETPSEREGIEDGARETRLKVVLRGILASTEDGLGHAVIEHKNKQAVYAVEDKLPVQGKVVVAKVMPQQVVLNNRGTYELLKLYDDSPLGKGKAKRQPTRKAPKAKPAQRQAVDKREDTDTTALAKSFRDTLYTNPQSLSKLVRVGAVRKDGALLGYRVTPGQQKEQFSQLGFESGDMVTSVNGIKLDNPANTMQLYNAMRSAGEVVFEVERNNQPMTISVNLDGAAQ